MNFRHDINGLRAIAVVAVVLFHFQIPGFEAGYLGVDVFFVISGFLMAAILMRGGGKKYPFSGGGIPLWSFYVARARRIVPALAVLVAVLLLVGWWTLGPSDYEQLALHARYALGFWSNHQFYEEAGYFDVASHEKWLLHTWSLSVEWQFYLLLPVAFILLWRIWPRREWLIAVVVLGLVASLAVSVLNTPKAPSAAFYLLPARAWELLAGVLVYLVSDRVHLHTMARRGLELLGLGLILAALVVFDMATPWPGSAAVLPVLGTSLVLLAMRHTPGWATPFPMQWLGRTSYSLYLWHWPAFVALVFLDWQHEPWAIAGALLVALVLADASYRWVEQPTRHSLVQAGLKWGPGVLVLVVVLIVLFALWVKDRDGVPGRMPAQFDAIVAEANNTSPYRDECHGRPAWGAFPWCEMGGETPRAVVVGDSHASMLVSAARKALPNPEADGLHIASYTSCPTLLGVKKPRPELECAQFNDFVLERLEQVPAGVPLIVSNRLSGSVFGAHQTDHPRHGVPTVYFGDAPVQEATPTFLADFREQLVSSACRLAEDRPVYWVRPVPEMPVDVPRWMARQTLLRGSLAEVSIPLEMYRERHAFVTEALYAVGDQCNVHVLDPEPWLCDEGRCYGTQDGLPLYYDDHHLSERGNKLLVPMFREVFDDLP